MGVAGLLLLAPALPTVLPLVVDVVNAALATQGDAIAAGYAAAAAIAPAPELAGLALAVGTALAQMGPPVPASAVAAFERGTGPAAEALRVVPHLACLCWPAAWTEPGAQTRVRTALDALRLPVPSTPATAASPLAAYVSQAAGTLVGSAAMTAAARSSTVVAAFDYLADLMAARAHALLSDVPILRLANNRPAATAAALERAQSTLAAAVAQASSLATATPSAVAAAAAKRAWPGSRDDGLLPSPKRASVSGGRQSEWATAIAEERAAWAALDELARRATQTGA